MMKRRGSNDTLVGWVVLIYIVLALFMFLGWVKNIVKLSDCDFETPYKCEVIHGVGLVPVVGMFTGWMDVGK